MIIAEFRSVAITLAVLESSDINITLTSSMHDKQLPLTWKTHRKISRTTAATGCSEKRKDAAAYKKPSSSVCSKSFDADSTSSRYCSTVSFSKSWNLVYLLDRFSHDEERRWKFAIKSHMQSTVSIRRHSPSDADVGSRTLFYIAVHRAARVSEDCDPVCVARHGAWCLLAIPRCRGQLPQHRPLTCAIGRHSVGSVLSPSRPPGLSYLRRLHRFGAIIRTEGSLSSVATTSACRQAQLSTRSGTDRRRQ